MKQLLPIIGFILFCLAGIAGTQAWPQPEISVGYFTISKNPYGIAIYQDGRHASVQLVDARSYSLKGNTITIPSLSKIIYSRDDIIFDNTSLFTDSTQEQIEYLQKKKVSTGTLPQIVYLVNPQIPGMLEFRGSGMRIDRNQKQIVGSITTVIVHDGISI